MCVCVKSDIAENSEMFILFHIVKLSLDLSILIYLAKLK